MGAVLTLDSALPAELIPPLSTNAATEKPENTRLVLESMIRRDRTTPPVERRTGQRTSLPVLFELRPSPCDSHNCEQDHVVVIGKDVSDQGIGFFHERPIPYRRGVLTFRPQDGPPLSMEVDLSWCRFTRMGWYESGGRLLRAVD